MSRIKVALIEDQQLFRYGIHALLKDTEDMEVVITQEKGRALLEQLAASLVLPDVILMDINMPELNGLELTGIIQKLYPSIKIIILTVYKQERFIIKMIEAGVAGYLLKNSDIEELVNAIRTVFKTGFYINDLTLNAMRSGYKYKNNPIKTTGNVPVELTDREYEVLRLLCNEYSNPEIAEKLHISVRTVEGHRNNLLAKTGCKNSVGLVLFAITNNLMETMAFN